MPIPSASVRPERASATPEPPTPRRAPGGRPAASRARPRAPRTCGGGGARLDPAQAPRVPREGRAAQEVEGCRLAAADLERKDGAREAALGVADADLLGVLEQRRGGGLHPLGGGRQ